MDTEHTPRRAQGCLLPTLLERLRDNDPSRPMEPDSTMTISRARMREIVRDSLLELLNTTNLEHEIPARYNDALDSVLNYGLPPLAGAYASEVKWQEVERMLRRAITRFEPRILPETLHITPPLYGENRTGNSLRFTIHAMIHMDPYPLEFALLNTIDLETNSVEANLIKA